MTAMAVAAMLTACADITQELSPATVEAQAKVPVVFDTYVTTLHNDDIIHAAEESKTLTRAGEYYVNVTNQNPIPKQGQNPGIDNYAIGVYGIYHDNASWNQNNWSSYSFDYMKNQRVERGADGAFTYSPLKYWPNEKGNTTDSQGATSPGNDKVTFFAYWPYSSGSDADFARTGIRPSDKPSAKFTISVPDTRQPGEQIDFLFSEFETDKTKTDGKITFKFHHMLSKVMFEIYALSPTADELPDPEPADAYKLTGVELTIKSITLKNLYTQAGYTPSYKGQLNYRYWWKEKITTTGRAEDTNNHTNFSTTGYTVEVPPMYGYFPNLLTNTFQRRMNWKGTAAGPYLTCSKTQHLITNPPPTWPGKDDADSKFTPHFRMTDNDKTILIVPQDIANNGKYFREDTGLDTHIRVVYDVTFTYTGISNGEDLTITYKNCAEETSPWPKDAFSYGQTLDYSPGSRYTHRIFLGLKRIDVDTVVQPWEPSNETDEPNDISGGDQTPHEDTETTT